MLVLGAAGAGLWISIGVTLTLGAYSPELSLRWWPNGALAKTAAAFALISSEQGPSADVERARILAADALSREPVNASAARVLALALIREGKTEAGRHLFNYGEVLSRRDLVTELWQIEHNSTQGDIAATLQHYDHALRVHESAYDLLFPTLILAANDDEIARHLAGMLSKPNPWGRFFLLRATQSMTNYNALYVMARAARLDPSLPLDYDASSSLVRRLVDKGQYKLAAAFYASLTDQSPSSLPTLRNGSFEYENRFPPFDWWLSEEPALAGVQEHRDGVSGLTLIGKSGRGGDVAHQLLLLAPGTYRLTGTAQGIAAARNYPTLRVYCLPIGTEIVRQSLPVQNAASRFSIGFTVPENCQVQGLRFAVGASDETEVRISNLSIVK